MTDLSPNCLLLVEDDPLVRLTVAMLMEDYGFRVSQAATAEEAISAMEGGLGAPVLVTDVDLDLLALKALPGDLAFDLTANRGDRAAVFLEVGAEFGRLALHAFGDAGEGTVDVGGADLDPGGIGGKPHQPA